MSDSHNDITRLEEAKALALTMVWLASHQKRWIALANFCHGSSTDCIVLPPNTSAANSEELMDWLKSFRNGGTDLTVPLEIIPHRWPAFVKMGMPRGKTDMVIITDGQLHVDPDMERQYKAWAKEEMVNTYGIVVGCVDEGELPKVCNRCWGIPSINMNEGAVQSVFSI